MQNSAQPTKSAKPIPVFDLIHVVVCLVVVGYYLLKFSGTSILTREGEFVLDTLLIGVVATKFFKTLNRNKHRSGEGQ